MPQKAEKSKSNKKATKSGGRGKIEPRWKKGESGNPKGAPKGVPKMKTILRRIEESTEPAGKILESLEREYPELKNHPKITRKEIDARIMHRGARQGMLKGDPRLATMYYKLSGELVDKIEGGDEPIKVKHEIDAATRSLIESFARKRGSQKGTRK